jgi:DNA (cytosine-5)-methyltransferase 1
MSSIRYIDLFSGLGAFHAAFNTSRRFQCVMACDIDEGARKIYEANYGLRPEGDIRSLDVARIPDFEILCAGFPCQPFSIAGNREGFQDTQKGNLFYDILTIIDAKKPPMCILENVKNLKTHDGGRTYRTIQTELERRGYNVTSRVINSAEYGSPQARQRIFIVASKSEFVIPEPVKRTVSVSSILDPDNTDVWDSSKYTLVAKTGAVRPGKPHILFDVMTKKSLKGGRQGERVYDVNSVGVTVCASSGGPGAKTGLYKVGDVIRRLSVKETLGMFGFPNDYRFPGISSEDSLFYLGNSIVVNVPLTFVPAIEKYFTEREA